MKDEIDKDVIKHHEYPNLEGKYKNIFKIPQILINKMHMKMNELYNNSNIKNPIVSSQIHKIILDLFIEDYYPLLSRNIKIDKHTIAVIMGGTAFNMSIPIKMNKTLYTPTDDVDIKIYTTDINNIVKNKFKLENVLSVYKYIVIIICFYMKQIATEIIEYSRNAFEPNVPYIKRLTMKNMKMYNQTIKLSSSKTKSQNGGNNNIQKTNINKLIKLKQRRFGILKSFKFKIQLKNEKEKTKDIIDITDLTYDETYKLIMTKLLDPDIMITTKISYSIKHINLMVPYNDRTRPTITFSDTKIIYPSIQNPYFFSYYFMSYDKYNKYNKNKYDYENITLEQILNQNINIFNIIDNKSCKNNCHYISIKYLQIDIIYMLRFAELLENEDILNGVIIVPVGSIFKYYKYMIKYIRTYIIKKFFNGTLANNKIFIDAYRKLIRYVENNLNKETNSIDESLPINIICKNIISNFHQAFFIKQTMFPEFEALRDIVNDYNNTVKFINRSCALFKKLDDNQDESGKTLDSISIQFGDNKFKDEMSKNEMSKNEMSKSKNNMNGGNTQNNKKMKFILHDNYSFEDIELDNNKNIINSKTHKTSLNENKIIIDKVHKMLKNEIHFLGKLSYSIKK